MNSHRAYWVNRITISFYWFPSTSLEYNISNKPSSYWPFSIGLPLNSAYSKFLKRVIASSQNKASLAKSCQQTMNISFFNQDHRAILIVLFRKWPKQLLLRLEGKRMIRNQSGPGKSETCRNTLHRVSFTQPKRVASHVDVPIVFTAPGKLPGLCHKINKKQLRVTGAGGNPRNRP